MAGLSGGLIGPPGVARDHSGSLDGTPIFLGCSDIDPHIPRERVEESAATLERLDGRVTMHLYSDMGHKLNQDGILFILEMMSNLVGAGPGGIPAS